MTGVPWALSTLLLGTALAYLSWIDVKSHRLPDAVTLPLVAVGLALSAMAGMSSLTAALIGGAVGFSLFALIGEIYFRRRGHEGLGLGDAKLFAAAGTWLGWSALPTTLLIAAGGALVFVVVSRRTAEHIPFGPWIALGFFTTWLAL